MKPTTKTKYQTFLIKEKLESKSVELVTIKTKYTIDLM